MENLSTVVEAAKLLLAQHEAYTAKPTKAESKRMRASISNMKKAAVGAKRELLEADKSPE
jgi:hypothetical protein